MPSRNTRNISPFEHIFRHKPDFSFLRVFGCRCYPHLRPYNKHKMDFRSIPCFFLGYNTSHHGYRCFDPSSKRIYVARHVRFTETSFPFHAPPKNPPQPVLGPYVSSYPTPLPPQDHSPPSTTPTQPTTPLFHKPNHTSTSTQISSSNLSLLPIIYTYHCRHHPPSNTTSNQLTTSTHETEPQQPTIPQMTTHPTTTHPRPRPFLVTNGLFGYVDDTIPCPPVTISV